MPPSPAGLARRSRVRAALGLSLRAELLLTIVTLAGGAAIIAALSVALIVGAADPGAGLRALSPLTALLVAADVALCALLAVHAVRRLLARPVAELLVAAESIAAGAAPREVSMRLPGEFGRLAGILHTLAQRLAAEQAQRARAEKLAGIGRLAAGIAHEIGNPLGAINGYAYVLGARLEHTPELRELVASIETESARIDRIVHGLLDYARPRLPTPTVIDINDTVRSAVSLLAAQGALHRVRVREELDPSAPTLYGERHQLEQVFVNLLLNAVDASPAGGEIVVRTERYPRSAIVDGESRRVGDPPLSAYPRDPTPRARLWLERHRPPAEVVNVVVADAGPGVPEEERERIFEPFVTTKERGRGTGLGLAIVSSVVDGFGGTVWVESAREGGAAFHMLFPVAVGQGTPIRRARARDGAAV